MKIKNIEIEAFRGIPGKLSICLEKNGNCQSLLLFGDNGTGKSSIFDAIEFALQARINRTNSLKNQFFPFPISLFKSSNSIIKVEFSDNSNTTRQILIQQTDNDDELFYAMDTSVPHDKFSLSPIALRRRDILQFNNTPSRERQVVFFDFLRDSQKEDWDKNPPIEYEKLLQKKNKLKQLRRQKIGELATKLKIDVELIPLQVEKFDDFVREHIYKGLNKKQRASMIRRGIGLKVDEKTLKIISDIKSNYDLLKTNSKEINELKRNNINRLDKRKITQEILERISEFFTISFNKIAQINHIEKIVLKAGEESEVSLNIEVVLKNGKIGNPNNVFSEAYLDLTALLLFLSFLKESSTLGQSKILILDDVLQSVDSTIRLSFVDFLLKEFKDWQILISAHDRLWMNQLRILFRQNNHQFVDKEIINWEFSNGPILKNATPNLDDLLEHEIEKGQVQFVSSQTGIFLEQICNELSFSLPISVKRRYEDKYTLGDLWSGVYKVLRKTNIKEHADKVEKYLHLRNLIGAHYNSWAYSLSNSEINEFGNSAIQLYREVFCKSCNTWIKNINDEKLWQCKCKKLKIE